MDYSIGSKKIKGIRIEMQLGLAVLLNKRFVDYRTLNIGIGITSDLTFEPKLKADAKKKSNDVAQ